MILTSSDVIETPDVHFQPFRDRQRAIEKELHFHCACSRCRAGASTDKALEQIRSAQQILDDWSSESLATPNDALNLIRQYKEEGFEAFLDVPYGYAALAYNAIGDPAKAGRYATLAADVLFSHGRIEDSGYAEWEELASNPEIHWSWLGRPHQ